MIPRVRPSPELLRLAAGQAGVLSTEQVTAFGLTRKPLDRLLAQEFGWQRLDTGIYLTSPGEPGWPAWAWGGVLIGGDRARLGGAAAGHLWGLGPEPSTIDVFVPEGAGRTSRSPWRFRRERPGLRRLSQGTPPRTTVEDTVLDLCGTLDEPAVVGLLTSAVQSRRTTPARILQRLEERGRLRHRPLLTGLLAEIREGAESPLEVAYLRDVERAHGLPRGIRQHRASGGRQVRDVVYAEFGLVVELDGRLGHEGMGRFRDMRRDNDALLRGEVTLRYGWSDVRGRCCPVAWQVGSILIRSGWNGIPSRCPSCRAVPIEELGVA